MLNIIRSLSAVAALTIAASAWAGTFEGTWNGIVERGSGGGSCKEMQANVTVTGNQVAGSVHHGSGGVADISGTIADDGSFDGRAGTAHVKGKFSGDKFDGVYKSGECGDRTFTMSR